jgi:hypothetical protein
VEGWRRPIGDVTDDIHGFATKEEPENENCLSTRSIDGDMGVGSAFGLCARVDGAKIKLMHPMQSYVSNKVDAQKWRLHTEE